jgi:hypothetical protein
MGRNSARLAHIRRGDGDCRGLAQHFAGLNATAVAVRRIKDSCSLRLKGGNAPAMPSTTCQGIFASFWIAPLSSYSHASCFELSFSSVLAAGGSLRRNSA